jgi:putative exporter of polyketide antibiotics
MSRLSVLRLYGVPGKMTRRLLGVVIGTQGLGVFFGALVARSLAEVRESHTSSTFLLVGSLLAVLCILDAGLLRRPWGVTLGWVLQVATFAFALIVPVMALVGLLFGALWLTALVQGRNMDEHTRVVDAQWHAARESTGAQQPPPGPSVPDPSVPDPSVPDPSAPEAPTLDG